MHRAGLIDQVQCGPDDAFGVKVVVPVDLVQGAGLPEAGDAECCGRDLVDRGEEGQSVRVTVQDRDQGCRPVGGKHLVKDPVVGRVLALAGTHGAVEEVGAGDAEDVSPDAALVKAVGGREGLRYEGAHDGEGHCRVVCAPQRVGPGYDLPSAVFPGGRIDRDGGEALIDRAGGQPQVGRCAVRLPKASETGQQGPFGVDDEGRFVGDAAGLFKADGGSLDRLVGTPSGARVTPEGVPTRMDCPPA